MASHQEIRRRVGALLLAAAAISVVVPSALAASEKPAPVYPPTEQKLIAALDAETQARVARVASRRAVVEARLAETVERWREAEAIELEISWRQAEASELEISWRQAEASELAALWREADAVEVEISLPEVAAKPHPIRAAIDVLVGLARVPARAALTARHLIEAFAKVTPRVVRVLS